MSVEKVKKYYITWNKKCIKEKNIYIYIYKNYTLLTSLLLFKYIFFILFKF